MTEGVTIQQDIQALRRDVEQAQGESDPVVKADATLKLLGKSVGALEGCWSAIEILRADEDESDLLDEVEGPSETERGTDE